MLPKLPPADHVYFASTTDNGRFTVLVLDSGTEPAQSLVVDWQAGKLTRWHADNIDRIQDPDKVARGRKTHPR